MEFIRETSMLGRIRLYHDVNSREYYPLTEEDVQLLRVHGNQSSRWDLLRKTRDEKLNALRIRDCTLHGRVVFGVFDEDIYVEKVPVPSGCYRSILSDVVVGDNALVLECSIIRNTIIGEFSTIVRCGSICGPSQDEPWTSFGNGHTIHVGVETGGRDLPIVIDVPYQRAADVVTKRGDQSLQGNFKNAVQAYTSSVSCPFTIISSHARVYYCSTIKNSFIGSFAFLQDSIIKNSTINSSKDSPSSILAKSFVENTLMQSNCSINTASIVQDALLFESASVERQGIVQSAVLGPNTCVAEGEVTASFVGPFVGFHHQALLIAAIWPEGKGNVGYGANVGSNHTLKAPDQELRAGEGVFFGLASQIKYPSNFSRAPYTVIATGVMTLPQKLEMPFSLVNVPSHTDHGLSPAINEIFPGWVLSKSVFTVLRNAMKFETRNKAKSISIDPNVFHPGIVKYMKLARAQLREARPTKLCLGDGERVYTDKQVPGLGKNYMRESSRQEGIQAYTFFIQLYALEGLLSMLESKASCVKIDSPVASINASSSFALETLKEELSIEWSIRKCLEELVRKKRAIFEMAVAGKKRDDARGRRISSDYDHVHKRVEEESVIVKAQRDAEDVKHRIDAFTSRM